MIYKIIIKRINKTISLIKKSKISLENLKDGNFYINTERKSKNYLKKKLKKDKMSCKMMQIVHFNQISDLINILETSI